MTTIYIVPIEPIDARYTKQWYHNIPVILQEKIDSSALDLEVVTIDGVSIPPNTTTGAFLDFGATNVYKASQAEKISRMFSDGVIKPGDKFLVTDAWNFVITPIKYMSDLLDIPVEIHGIWHAGAYDPSDILGYKMNKPWPWHQERSWFYSCDYNYFATEFHKNMFLKNLGIETEQQRAVRSGQPHTPIIGECSSYWYKEKSKTVIWPHRYNADKQPEIVKDLAEILDHNLIITQKMNLSKKDYYETLGNCSVMFSCSLHENLGISMMEGVLAGVIPVVPDRCSYSEMYMDEFKYPAEWTENFESYTKYAHHLKEFIDQRVNNRYKFLDSLARQRRILIETYLNANIMIDKLLDNV
jgi:hypothetical protein